MITVITTMMLLVLWHSSFGAPNRQSLSLSYMPTQGPRSCGIIPRIGNLCRRYGCCGPPHARQLYHDVPRCIYSEGILHTHAVIHTRPKPSGISELSPSTKGIRKYRKRRRPGLCGVARAVTDLVQTPADSSPRERCCCFPGTMATQSFTDCAHIQRQR
ncbi:hypothetical protein BC835DRAFT_424889 [Cytidiella melzeri]|nr:hypothetical protein BC835DRAFT_424889 [Cytidiella melzeri]